MSILTEKIDNILKQKDLSRYKASKLINYPENTFSQMMRGERPFSKLVIKKFLPILEVSREEFEGWILADKYSKEVLELAIKTKKAHCHCEGINLKQSKKRILTTKIDSILQEKDMSRTDLSKQIKYSQSGLNRMIVGEINMSKPVLEKVASVLDISQDEITSWILADKYSLQVLETAYSCK